jgi:hypothetical protein
MNRLTKCDEGALVATPQTVHLRLVRCDDDDPVKTPNRHRQRPSWWLLYTIVLLVLAVLWANDSLLPDGLARSLADSMAVIVCIGLTRLWLGANRCCLVRKAAEVQHVHRAPVNGRAGSRGRSSHSASSEVSQ